MPGAPVVIEAAINGMTTAERNRNVPGTPAQIAADALRCIDAGASVVHTHADTVGAYVAAWGPVLEARPDALLYPTQRIAPTMAERLAHYEPLMARAGMRIGMVDPGCVNVTWADDDGLPDPGLGPYVNDIAGVRDAFALCDRLRLGPSVSIYEPTWLNHTLAFHRAGRLPRGAMVKLYFGGPNGYFARGRGVSFGLPPTVKALAAYLEVLELGGGGSLPWSVSAIGADLLRTPVARLALEAGGHLKVGLEDHSGDRTPTNARLVEEAAELAASVGRPVATSGEAAALLGLPAR
jgi:uncharacterized protein (DUF849 family)